MPIHDFFDCAQKKNKKQNKTKQKNKKQKTKEKEKAKRIKMLLHDCKRVS